MSLLIVCNAAQILRDFLCYSCYVYGENTQPESFWWASGKIRSRTEVSCISAQSSAYYIILYCIGIFRNENHLVFKTVEPSVTPCGLYIV